MFNRSIKRIIGAIFVSNHWISIFKIFVICRNPFQYLSRYILGGGGYPWLMEIRTPIGTQKLELHRFEDIFTINEIFMWEVYKVDNKVRVFLDIGGNVGFASLYFLTRNYYSTGIIVEPLPQNIRRAKELLSCFTSRIEFIESAVSVEDGYLEIGVEPTGRYSGIDCLDTGTRQVFHAVGINSLLSRLIGQCGNISIVKIDCEGAERQFMPKIRPENLVRIARFRVESQIFDDKNLIVSNFTKSIIFDDGVGGYVFDYHRII
jgi:FkbM family methyltransferase